MNVMERIALENKYLEKGFVTLETIIAVVKHDNPSYNVCRVLRHVQDNVVNALDKRALTEDERLILEAMQHLITQRLSPLQ